VSRPIDPAKYESRRAAIVEAASEQFSTLGYQRSTTAGICRAAGISSGTFFHYFPTKLDALVAVLESGRDDLRAQLADIERRVAGLEALLSYASWFEAEIADPSYPVFAAGFTGVESEPLVAAALEAEARVVRGFLLQQVGEGQARGEIRRDASQTELATWASWLLDGAAQAAAITPSPDRAPIQAAMRAILGPLR
jgi:AcrR family transcriptional regulator